MNVPQLYCLSKRLALGLAITSISLATTTSTAIADGHSHGPIYRTLDAMAGGIEMVIDAASRHGHGAVGTGDASCDDGCDAMMMNEFSEAEGVDYLPMPPVEHASPNVSTHGLPMAPMATMPHPLPPVVSAPRVTAPRMIEPTPMVSPSSRPPSSRPMPIPTPQPARVMTQPQAAPMAATPDDDWLQNFAPEPTRSVPAPRTMRRSPAETFDSLPDPFRDDPQSRRSTPSTIQPASYWAPW